MMKLIKASKTVRHKIALIVEQLYEIGVVDETIARRSMGDHQTYEDGYGIVVCLRIDGRMFRY